MDKIQTFLSKDRFVKNPVSCLVNDVSLVMKEYLLLFAQKYYPFIVPDPLSKQDKSHTFTGPSKLITNFVVSLA